MQNVERADEVSPMAVERRWAWDLDEMRDAATEPGTQKSKILMVSGFTPINGPRTTEIAKSKPKPDNLLSNEKLKKAPALKRQKTESPSSKAARKARKPPSSRKTQGKRKTGDPKCSDIAKGLARTKPIQSANRVSSDKTEISSATTLIGQYAAVEPLIVASSGRKVAEDLDSDGPMRLPGLAEKYQAAYAEATLNGIDPRLLQKNDESKGGLEDLDATADPNWPLAFSSSNLMIEAAASLQRESYDDEGRFLQDFEVPPSAQIERYEGPGDLPSTWQSTSLTKAICQNHFSSDEVFGDSENVDDFPIDDEDLGEIMQAVSPSGILGDGDDDDWRPQEFTDDPLIFEELDDKELQQEVTSSHWVAASGPENPHAPLDTRIEISPSRQRGGSSRVLSQISGNAARVGANGAELQDHSEDCFDDNDLDEDLASLAMNGSDLIQPQTPTTTLKKPSSPKLQWMPPKTFTPAKSSQLLSSPISTTYSVPVNQKGNAIPFTRPPFPKPIRDRSPILGLSNQMVLRTCFRIGEALNAAAVASRSNVDAMIELYARIIFSEREANKGYKQLFQFGDVFTDKPPYLHGTYSLWKGVGLWDVDSRIFIGEKGRGKMARVMGRIKRCERGDGCEIVILSIWEVDWEDFEVAKGIVCF